MASVVAFLTSWPRRHWSKEIAVKEFSSIQSCPSSVIQKDEHSLALGSELLTTGSSGKDLGPGRETAAHEALARLVSQNEDAVIIKLSLGGLVQVEGPKVSLECALAPGWEPPVLVCGAGWTMSCSWVLLQ